jgi:hemerythrin
MVEKSEESSVYSEQFLEQIVPKQVLMISGKADGTNLLLQDHLQLFSLYNKKFLSAQSPEQKKQIWTTISNEICSHFAVIRVVICPLVAEFMEGGDDLVLQTKTEHENIERMLQKMSYMDASDAEFGKMADQVMRELKKHVEREEPSLIPVIREKLEDQQLRLLYAALNDAKTIAPHTPFSGEEWFAGPYTNSFELLRKSFIHPI